MLMAWLHVTDRCNLRCRYCYLNKTKYPEETEVDSHVFGRFFVTVYRFFAFFCPFPPIFDFGGPSLYV